MKIDMHLHADFSADSQIRLEELIPPAIERGYRAVCITEHFDFAPSELALYGLPPYLPYTRHIERMRESFPGIEIVLGVEAGEYHRFHVEADRVFAYRKPDVTVASLHVLQDGSNVSTPMPQPLSVHQIQMYYEENLAMVRRGNFDILGHLGIYKRYYESPPEESHFRAVIEQILLELIRRDMILEVNYSSLRKPYREILPEPEFLQMYRMLGGRLITLGSDAHRLEDFDDYYDIACTKLRECGFESLFWIDSRGQRQNFPL